VAAGGLAVSARLAWTMPSLALVLLVAATLLPTLGGGAPPGLFEPTFSAMILGYAAVGGIVAARRPDNPIGWLLAAGALCAALTALGAEYGEHGLVTDPGSLPGARFAAWVAMWVVLPAWGAVLFLLLLFPTGRLLTARWRWAARLTAASVGLGAIAQALVPRQLSENEAVANPFHVSGAAGDVLAVLNTVTDVATLPTLLLALGALVVRLRRSRGEERLQLEWFVYVAAVAALGLILGVVGENAVGSGSWLWQVPFYLGMVALAALPVAIAVAMLRYRLYDIDLVINRTLVYAALSATLAGAYLGGVLVLGLVVRPLTGSSNLAIAGSTLAVAALFGPARAQIQRVVDRRFYRRRYDAARTLEAFGARLRDEVDLEALGADLRHVVVETMAPAHVSLWLREARR